MAAAPLTLEEFPRTAAVLAEYATAVLNAYQDRLIRDNKIATGDLLNSAEYVITSENGSILVQLSLESYWKYVEHGRRPGKFPPPTAIIGWIQAKPVIPKPDSSGKLPTVRSLAYLIGRKIATEGIKPTNALAAAAEGQTAVWEERIRAALAEDFTEGLALIIRQ